MQGELHIPLGPALTIGRLENTLVECTPRASKATKIHLDAALAEYVGLFPAVLLIAWIRQTLARTRLKTPPIVRMSLPSMVQAQPARVLVDLGLAAAFRLAGADVKEYSPTEPRDAMPVLELNDLGHLRGRLQGLSADFRRRCDLQSGFQEVLDDAFHVVLFELAENAILYGTARGGGSGETRRRKGRREAQQTASLLDGMVEALPPPGLGRARVVAALALASGSAERRGIMRQYPMNSRYLEIVVSDDGPGIGARLRRPPDWSLPPFWDVEHAGASVRAMTNAEETVLFAFEWGSSSDPGGRLDRIRRLLASESRLSAAEVPTGLFCVLKTVQRFGGQLVVRTPHAMVSIDFFENPNRPTVRLRDSITGGALAPLHGTHYVLRLPLSPTHRRAPAVQLGLGGRGLPAVLDAFQSTASHEADEATTVQSGLQEVSRYLLSRASVPGTILVRGPNVALTPRARSVFVLGLQTMLLGEQEILWLADTPVPLESGFETEHAGAAPTSVLDGRIAVGDPFGNDWLSFDSLDELRPAASKSVRGQLGRTQRDSILTEIRRWTGEQLLHVVRNPPVHLSGGPFRLPRRYYTSTYFDIHAFFESEPNTRLFAEWVAATLLQTVPERRLEMLVTTPLGLHRVGEAVADLLGRAWGTRPHVVPLRGDVLAPSAALLFNEYSGKRAALVADVICTGQSLDRVLDGATSFVDITSVVCVVDARPERERGKDFRALRGNLSLPVIALHDRDSIAASSYIPPTIRADGRRGFHVVEPESHRLLYHLVPNGPAVNLQEFLDDLLSSRAVFVGHFERDKRHLTHFVDFRVFFVEQQEPISRWIISATREWFENLQSELDGRPGLGDAKVFALNERGALSWLEATAEIRAGFGQRPLILRSTLDGLLAALVSESPVHCVIVLPALVSGQTARRLLHAASAAGALSVLLLVVASRSSPEQWAFLEGVTRFYQTETRLLRFVDFPAGAYDTVTRDCPVCTAKARLEALAAQIDRVLGKESRLGGVAREKARAMQQRLAPDESDEHTTLSQLTNHEKDQLMVRLLYEAARDDDSAAEDLRLKMGQQRYKDAFLAVLSRERYDRHFELREMESHLGGAFPLLTRRAEAMITSGRPPLPLGRYLGALTHLRPMLIGLHGASLHQRFRSSPRDEKELALTLAELAVEPVGIASEIYESVASPSEETAEAIDFARRVQEERRRSSAGGVSAIMELWALLVRHSKHAKGLEAVSGALNAELVNWQAIRDEIGKLRMNWEENVRRPIADLITSGFWVNLSRLDMEKWLLAELEQEMATVGRLADLSPERGRDDPEKVREQARQSVLLASGASERLVRYVEGHHASVLNASICALEPITITDTTSRTIQIERDIDRRVGNVFLDPQEFDEIATSLVRINWRKHASQSKTVPRLMIRVSQADPHVCIEFADSIPTYFVDGSSGDVQGAQDLCSRLGGWSELRRHDAQGVKRLVLYLRRLRGDVRPTLDNVRRGLPAVQSLERVE